MPLSKSSKHFSPGSPEAALNGAAGKVMRAGVPAGSADRRKRYEMNERGFAGDSFTGTKGHNSQRKLAKISQYVTG